MILGKVTNFKNFQFQRLVRNLRMFIFYFMYILYFNV